MAIAKGYKQNFDTLLHAARAGDLALMECADKATGEVVIAICAVQREEDGEISMIPFAKMFDGDPYDELLSPMEIDERRAAQ